MRRRKRMMEELERDIREHIERETRDNIERGMAPEEARRAARLKFGNVALVQEDTRAVWSILWLEQLWQDVRYGLRMLRKSPGFTAVAVVTLALGIGANAAIFSVVDWLMLRTPEVAQPSRVVTLATEEIGGGYSNGFSYPDFEDIREQSKSVFSAVAGALEFEMDGLSADGKSRSIATSYVSGNFFQVMGLKPAVGRLIEPGQGGSPDAEPVLVLGYAFWQSRFGGDRNVVGKSVAINGHPVTIIGVAPKGYRGLTSVLNMQGYLPLGMARATGAAGTEFLTERKSGALTISARLKTGVRPDTAQAALDVIARRLSAQHPEADKWASLREYGLGPMSPVGDPSLIGILRLVSGLFLLLAGLVLLLACLNVANLLLARAAGREREMAFRTAVGAGRSRLVRQLLTESLMLALAGCAGGIVLGLLGSRALGLASLGPSLPLSLDFQFDWRVFAYAFGAALTTGLVVGIAPALRATRGNLNQLLHEGARTASAHRSRARATLVVVQVGGSLMLLIVAGLFVRSLWNVRHSPLGFDPHHVLNFTLDSHEAGYDQAQARDFQAALLRRVRALPGVETASLAASVPMGYLVQATELKIRGYQPPGGNGFSPADFNAVSSQYFETLRIPIVRGQGFRDSDGEGSPRVAVINQALAEKYWHGEDPIGRHFTTKSDPERPIEVVGEVANSKTENLAAPYDPFLYFPLAQRQDYRAPVTLQVRTTLSLGTMNGEIRGIVHSLAPAMPVFNIETMAEALDTVNGYLLFQIGAVLAGALGFLGLVLALVGVYGVVSYGVSRRRHEIGIRMAVGAQPEQVLNMVLRQGFVIVGAGITGGILAAAAVARLVGHFLVDVSPTDALTYAGASIGLALVAMLAGYIPARRAMKVDPVVALRNE